MNAGRKILLSFLFAGLTLAAFGAESKEAKDGKDPKAAKETKPTAAPTPPLSPRFKQVRDKITALFGHRNEPPPPPEPRANPFRPPGAVAVAPVPTASGDIPLPVVTEPEPPSSDLTKLQASLASLKFGGTLERGGHLYLMINGKPYTENEVVQVQAQGETVYLRVRQISRRSATIGLNDAEMTWNTGGPSK